MTEMAYKTTWGHDALTAHARKHGLANASDAALHVCRGYEAESGVKWDWFHARGKVQLTPVDENVAPKFGDVFLLAAILAAYAKVKDGLTGYASYLSVCKAGSLSMVEVMGHVKALEKRGQARRTVNRNGKAHAFKLVGVTT